MKKASILLVALFIMVGTTVQAQKKSPPMNVEDKIGSTEVKINYSAPSVRGRVIFGGLEPWGKVWRAGANNATTISFSKDVTIEGQKLAAGTYAFFITPMEKGNWKITFNTVSDQWGAYKHDTSKDALVADVKPKKIDMVEQLKYGVDKNMIYMDWSKTRVAFTVK